MNNKIDWKNIIEYYNTIKSLYIKCEESDPELKTNLQPLNEFRAALDHLMRIVAIENIPDYQNEDSDKQVEKLWSHLRRVFYDICDMLSINYRNKIIDMLEIYTSDEIMKVIPEYYSQIRPDIENMSKRISELRSDKNFDKQKEIENCEDYQKIIFKLKEYYETISDKNTSLVEIHKEKIALDKKNKKSDVLRQIVIPIAGIVIGAVLAIVGFLC